MERLVVSLCLAAVSAFAQNYRALSVGGPPKQLAPAIRDALNTSGVRVVNPNGYVFAEVWLRNTPVADSVPLGDALRDGKLPEGTLVGAARYAAPGADAQGQGFATGVYTLRYAGGDSVLLIAAADDQTPDAMPLDQAQQFSRKVSKTDHPAALRISTGKQGKTPRLEMTSDGEWIVHTTSGDTPVDLLILGLSKG